MDDAEIIFASATQNLRPRRSASPIKKRLPRGTDKSCRLQMSNMSDPSYSDTTVARDPQVTDRVAPAGAPSLDSAVGSLERTSASDGNKLTSKTGEWPSQRMLVPSQHYANKRFYPGYAQHRIM